METSRGRKDVSKNNRRKKVTTRSDSEEIIDFTKLKSKRFILSFIEKPSLRNKFSQKMKKGDKEKVSKGTKKQKKSSKKNTTRNTSKKASRNTSKKTAKKRGVSTQKRKRMRTRKGKN